MKILLSAYACDPEKGSEPGVGWNVASVLAPSHDVWILTRAENRAHIESALARKPMPSLHFVYYDLPSWSRLWKRGPRGVAYYYLWQLGVLPIARDLHRTVGFDILHHVTLGKYWAPSLLAVLSAPFVWGPVGGGESTPALFRPTFGLGGRLYEALRATGRWLGEHDPLIRLTARRSAVALAKTEDTGDRLRRLGAINVRVFSESGLLAREVEHLNQYPPPIGGPVKFISVSRLLGWKGVHLGLQAFARANIDGAEYWVVGDGPERKHLETLARALSMAGRVRFYGFLPHEAMWRMLGEAHVLVHPSLHDSGGDICLEAMAAGRPVICLDLGGPRSQVTAETGIKVPARDPEQATRDLAAAMRYLAYHPERRKAMGEAGRRKMEAFRWESKAEFLNAMYREASQRLPKSGGVEGAAAGLKSEVH